MIEIEDFLLAAEATLGVPAEELAWTVDVAALQAALSAPFAQLGGFDFYPHPIDRAAVLASQMMRRKPLPQGAPVGVGRRPRRSSRGSARCRRCRTP